MSTTTPDPENDYDPILEHIIQNVIGQALDGPRYASRWMERLHLNGCITIFDFIELTPER